MDIKVLKNFITNCSGINKIIASPDHSLWLCNNKSKTIEHVLPSGEILQKISSLNMWFIDIAQTSTGDLLFSTEDSYINVIPAGTSTVQKASNFYVPLGRIVRIHVNEEKRKIIVAVCMKEYKDSSQIIVMDEEGKHEYLYQIFDTPGSIATINNNIAVVDLADRNFKDGCGHVVIIDHDSRKVINTYKGHINTFRNGYYPFRPYDVVATKLGNFIVSDICLNNPIIHILTSDGDYLMYFNTKEKFGICLPFTLAVDDDGILYVGSQTYKGERYAYLHLLQINE